MKRIDNILEVIKQAVAQGNAWYDSKIKQGYKETEFGLMSMDEIKKAGLVFSNGKYVIPADTYIAERRMIGMAKGQKYTGISAQFLKWYKEKNGTMSIEDKINKQIEKEEGIEEMNIEDIPF